MLPFTVRSSGTIYYVKTRGFDTDNGSWSTPWRTISKAVDSMADGDIVYVGDGIAATARHEFHGCVNLNEDGTALLPRALVAYPGATVTVGGGGATCDNAFDNWNGSKNSRSKYWTISKMRALGVGGDQSAMSAYTGDRCVVDVFDRRYSTKPVVRPSYGTVLELRRHRRRSDVH